MDLPFRRKPVPQAETTEEITLTQEEANTVKNLIAAGRAKTVLDQDEWLFIPETYANAKKYDFVTKDLSVSMLKSAEDRELADMEFELLQYVHHNLPDSEEKIRRTCFDMLYGTLGLNCSDNGWARALTKTQHAVLEKRGGDIRVGEPKKTVV